MAASINGPYITATVSGFRSSIGIVLLEGGGTASDQAAPFAAASGSPVLA
jgi:hypothetical protein